LKFEMTHARRAMRSEGSRLSAAAIS
jgi:hypothetical protein